MNFSEEVLANAGDHNDCLDTVLESIMSGNFLEDVKSDPFGMATCIFKVILAVMERLDSKDEIDEQVIGAVPDDAFVAKCSELCAAEGKSVAGGGISSFVLMSIVLPLLKDRMLSALEEFIRNKSA